MDRDLRNAGLPLPPAPHLHQARGTHGRAERTRRAAVTADGGPAVTYEKKLIEVALRAAWANGSCLARESGTRRAEQGTLLGNVER